MATMLPPVYGVAFEFDCVLFNADGEILANPTIAAGDFVISKENGATANLTTLPSVTPAGSGIVRVQLSAEEMQAHKSMVKWHDVAGGEWRDGAFGIFTSGQTLDTIDALIDTLVARLTADRAGYLDKLNVSGTLAHSDAADTYKADVSGLALEATAQAVLEDTVEIGAAGAGLTALGDTRLANLDATVSSRLSTAGYTAPPAAAAVADAVWDEATAGHATAGSTGAALTAAGNAGDPWATTLPGAYGAGTAGAIVGGWDDSVFTAVATAAAVNGSDLSIHRGDTFSASVTGLGDISGRTQLYFTIKSRTSHTDAEALVQVEEDAGLMTLNRAAAADSTDGDITVTNAATGALTLTLAAEATAVLPTGVYYYDIQQVTATGVETLTAAQVTVVADVTRATS